MKQGWEYGILDDAVKKGSSNISLNKIKDEEGNYPVFGAKGFAKNVSFFDQNKDYLAIIKDGAGIGRVSKHPKNSSVLATLQYIIPKDGFDIDFIKYLLNQVDFEKHRNGSTIPHIYFKDYKTEPFPLLPLSEQKRIVKILDEAFAAIDEAKANAEKNLQNSRELFESYLNKVFANLRKDWEEKKLADVCEVKDGTHDSPRYVDDEDAIPFITQKNILNSGLSFEKTNFISKTNHDNFYRRSNVAYNDILISMIGANRGMACVVDNRRTFSIKNVGLIKSNDSYLSEFMLYFLKSKYAKQYIQKSSKGSAQGFIGLGKLRNFPILLPHLSTQKKIVNRVSEILTETKKLETIYQQKLADLDELKKSILQKAFDGELTRNSG